MQPSSDRGEKNRETDSYPSMLFSIVQLVAGSLAAQDSQARNRRLVERTSGLVDGRDFDNQEWHMMAMVRDPRRQEVRACLDGLLTNVPGSDPVECDVFCQAGPVGRPENLPGAASGNSRLLMMPFQPGKTAGK